MNIFKATPLIAGLLVLATSPAAGQRPRHITALDVRRACLNPDSAAQADMTPICSLKLPETRRQMAQQGPWQPWSALFLNTTVDPAALIQRYSTGLDEEQFLLPRFST